MVVGNSLIAGLDEDLSDWIKKKNCDLKSYDSFRVILPRSFGENLDAFKMLKKRINGNHINPKDWAATK